MTGAALRELDEASGAASPVPPPSLTRVGAKPFLCIRCQYWGVGSKALVGAGMRSRCRAPRTKKIDFLLLRDATVKNSRHPRRFNLAKRYAQRRTDRLRQLRHETLEERRLLALDPLAIADMDIDFGDLPAPYNTTLAQNGPLHEITDNLFLGDTPDDEADGQPDASALGDDSDGNDDEDGVSLDKWRNPFTQKDIPKHVLPGRNLGDSGQRQWQRIP